MNELQSTTFQGLTITAANIIDNELRLSFDNGVHIAIWDNGQSCCENRYMSTDDDVATLVGGKLLHVDAKPGPEIGDDDDNYHEQIFVEIATTKGLITIVNHNEHNGYYGGFGLTITERES